jgi:hypothetical protein
LTVAFLPPYYGRRRLLYGLADDCHGIFWIISPINSRFAFPSSPPRVISPIIVKALFGAKLASAKYVTYDAELISTLQTFSHKILVLFSMGKSELARA